MRILLATLNAKFIHASFGLRYLMANLGPLQAHAEIAEFDINQRPLEIVERIAAGAPDIAGFGVYIWNVRETTEVIALLRRVSPHTKIIIGGPEVSYETEGQEIVALADHVITGEADVKFAEVCSQIIARVPLPKIITAELPKLDALALPYHLYTDADLAHRVIYVEASRGCPFTCEFCLSSLDIPVRAVPLAPFLAAMERLLSRGARQFKFVDRTFNLHLPTSTAILRFFLEHWRDGMFIHFEMIPDRLPEQLRDLIAKFPPGALQFEVGIQTFDDAVSQNISRRQNLTKLEANLRFLREHTGVHIHADLIVGLPGENVESFGRGFDHLVSLGPQEIQVGILKRLRGTPIIRHDTEFAMTYSPAPPYEILSTRDVPFAQMQEMRRFARFWDLYGNSGNFIASLPLLWRGASPFAEFFTFTKWLHARLRRTHEIALLTLAAEFFRYLTEHRATPREKAAAALTADWQRAGRKGAPPFLENEPRPTEDARLTPKRQSRHRGAAQPE